MDEPVCLENDILPSVIKLKEHSRFDDNHIESIKKLNIDFCETEYEGIPKYLGVQPYSLCAGYFIGADWLVQDKYALVVTPKLENIDFIGMFVSALRFDKVYDYFPKFYGVDFDKPPIRSGVFNRQLTPLIIIHYLAVLRRLTKRGLKKEYVLTEANLNSKVKGRIDIAKHIRQNLISGREERVYCRYQEYSEDSPENRLLKRALTYADAYINTLSHSSFPELRALVNALKSMFVNVSDVVWDNDRQFHSVNKMYKEYAEALRLAKMIVRKFNYSISEVKNDDHNEFTPVFWIDMSRLYEVYVYSMLYEQFNENIKFQIPGYCKTAVDFIELTNKIIIDAKYKPKYTYGNSGIIDDVRQISAYARDDKILKALGSPGNDMVDCLIIYPQKMVDNDIESDKNVTDGCAELTSFKNVENITDIATPIRGFRGFFKLSVPIPVVKD